MAITDKMLEQFKTHEELKVFCTAQQKTLIDLTKKLKVSEEEIKHLKKLLEGAVPVIKSPEKIDFSANDEESIARQQLYLLKQLSNERELNFEETKRVEIYSKILLALREKNPKPIETEARRLSDSELTASLEPGKGNDDRSSH